MGELFKVGVDPRTSGKHRERGPKRFWYTYADLARVYGVAVGTVKWWAATGRLEPGDLEAVAMKWLERRKG